MAHLEHPVPEGVAAPVAPYSPVVVSGDHVFVSGQVGFDPDRRLVDGGIEPQTRQTLENLRRTLRAAGCDLADVAKINAYLARREDVEVYNRIHRETFPEPHPARTTIVCGLSEGILVEIEAVARRRG
jgi:2-iminobutanoate/2-iminopropanoate deaminase